MAVRLKVTRPGFPCAIENVVQSNAMLHRQDLL